MEKEPEDSWFSSQNEMRISHLLRSKLQQNI